MEIEQRLAERVRKYRTEQQLSQEELAHRAGVHRTFVSQIERATKKTTIRSTAQIAKALGVTFAQLLDD